MTNITVVPNPQKEFELADFTVIEGPEILSLSHICEAENQHELEFDCWKLFLKVINSLGYAVPGTGIEHMPDFGTANAIMHAILGELTKAGVKIIDV